MEWYRCTVSVSSRRPHVQGLCHPVTEAMHGSAKGDSDVRARPPCRAASRICGRPRGPLVASYRMMRAASIAGLLAAGWAQAAQAEVRVRSNSPCVDAHQWSERLEALLQDYAGGAEIALELSVVAEAERDRTRLSIIGIDAASSTVLDRRFDLEPGACPSALELGLTVVEAAIRGLPVEAWTKSAPPAPIAASRAPLRGRLSVGLGLGLIPIAGSVELGLEALYGEGPHALALGLWASSAYSGSLGPGTPLAGLVLLEAGWQWEEERFGVGASVRSGALWVAGLGYPENAQAVAFTLEGNLRLHYRIGSLRVGLSVSASPLDRQLSTRAGETRRLAPLRLGPFFSVEL